MRSSVNERAGATINHPAELAMKTCMRAARSPVTGRAVVGSSVYFASSADE